MALSYGGITLALSTEELDALQSQYMQRDRIQEFEGLFSPPYNLGHLPFNYITPPTVKDLGRLYWPRSASRFAFGHFVVSDRILQQVRPLAYAGGTLVPLTLVIDDESHASISTDLYLLPPRPISQIGTPGVPGGNLWMMTLVDDRYFWWYRSGSITVNEGVTTWNLLYEEIASALGISLTIDTVDADYQMPTRRMRSLNQPLPVLLDAVAMAVGQQVIRKFDGTVETQNYDTAKADFDVNWSSLTSRSFGGRFYTVNSGTVSGDMFALVPDTVRVVFPQQYIENGVVDSVYSVDNTLSGLALPEYPSAVAGFSGSQVLWGDQYALVSTGGGSPTNSAELAAYAGALSRDWYLWNLGGTDALYAGVAAWDPEGITDSIELTYTSDMFTTRVQRGPWNDRAGGGLLKETATVSGGDSCLCAGVHVYHDADQSIPTGSSYTVLSFNSELFDTDDFHDDAVNNSRLTITVGLSGKYLIGCQVNWETDVVANYNARMVLTRGGVDTVIAEDETTNRSNSISTFWELYTGDYLQVEVKHNSGSTIKVLATASYTPEFWLMLACGPTLNLSGVYGQANGSPTLPGFGPHQTVNISEAHPTLGDNLSVSIAEDTANDRNTWTIDNKGIFTRANQSATTYGPRRRLDIDQYTVPTPINADNLEVTLVDAGASDESRYTINSLGVFGRVNSGGSYEGPRRSISLDRAVPSGGLINLDITLTDAPLNDELEWEIDNLGMFVRVNSGVTTNGPRRRLNFLDYNYGSFGVAVSWVAADDPGNDEIDIQAIVDPAVIVQGGGGRDWHYYKHISTARYFYNPWPVRYTTRNGAEYKPQTHTSPPVDDGSGCMAGVYYLETRGYTYDYIAIYVGSAAATSGSKVRLGIYSATSAININPNTLVLDAGEVLVDANGIAFKAISVTLTAGVYWLVIRYDNSTAKLPSIAGYGAGSTDQLFWEPYGVYASTVTTAGDGLKGGNVDSWVTGVIARSLGALAALPATFPASPDALLAGYEAIPLVFLRPSA